MKSRLFFLTWSHIIQRFAHSVVPLKLTSLLQTLGQSTIEFAVALLHGTRKKTSLALYKTNGICAFRLAPRSTIFQVYNYPDLEILSANIKTCHRNCAAP